MSLTIFSGGAQNHDKPERELHKVTEEPEPGSAEAMEIDLKCAEKVTDSDVESNADDKVRFFNFFMLKDSKNSPTERTISERSELLRDGR